MQTHGKRITVQSIDFANPPFRKLGELKIQFAERLTLIAGHNGIGKSTILGLVANTFGNTAPNGPKSYFGDPFYANIERIVYLALDEATKAKEHPAAAPIVVAKVGEREVRKRCAMTRRTAWRRARVVPRTVEKADDDPIGQDAKIPLPTIYLGIKRLASVGEADEKEVFSEKLTMDEEDRDLMVQFVGAIIIASQATTDVTHQSIRGSKKKTAQTGYTDHDAFAVSMGQDSLASIATALASFNRLKRVMGDEYPGGLLIVDELDVGFHPHAIERLVKALKQHAKQLDLQIIATTHSPKLIEAVHPQGSGNTRAPDTAVYLIDTKCPRLAENQSLAAVLADMALSDDEEPPSPPIKPTLCVYFEDPEGAQFCDALIPSAKRRALGTKAGVRIKSISLSIGGPNLVKLPQMDALFKNRVLVVDADTSVPKKAATHNNIVKLPCVKGASGTDRSPENTVKNFLRAVAEATNGNHKALLKFNTTNPSSDKICKTFFLDGDGDSSQRESSKAWWAKHAQKLKRWKVIEVWATCYPIEVSAFEAEFQMAVSHTAKRLLKLGLAKR